jgi:hypothetical protein
MFRKLDLFKLKKKKFNKVLNSEWKIGTVLRASPFSIGSNELFCSEFVTLSKALIGKVFLMSVTAKRPDC